MIGLVNFGKRLRTLRLKKQLTQEQFGELIGVTKAVISSYENAVSYPPYPILIRIALNLGVTTDSLLGLPARQGIDTSGLTPREVKAVQEMVDLLRSK